MKLSLLNPKAKPSRSAIAHLLIFLIFWQTALFPLSPLQASPAHSLPSSASAAPTASVNESRNKLPDYVRRSTFDFRRSIFNVEPRTWNVERFRISADEENQTSADEKSKLKFELQTSEAVADLAARAPVKYSCGLSHDLRPPCKDMQIVHHGTTSQVKQVLALSAVTGAVALPVPDVRQVVLDSDAFTQSGAPFTCALADTQFLQQLLIGVRLDVAATSAAGATSSLWTRRTHSAAGKCTVFPG